jgi:predicted aspartyl protease
MVIRVEIQGLTSNALIDTGAESTVLDTSLVERLSSLESYDAASYGVSLEGITGEVVEARVVREAQLVVANRNLRITNLFAADLRRLANFYGPEIHAILGMRQLREFDLTFDFRNNDVIFQQILH